MLDFEILEAHHAILIDTSFCQMNNVTETLQKVLMDNVSKYNIEIIEPDGKVIKKEQIKLLKKNMSLTNINSDSYYIIKGAEKMNAAAYNTMLKFLEEPPLGVHIIMITNDINGISETIRSRCVRKTIALASNAAMEEFYELEGYISEKNYIGFKKAMVSLYKESKDVDQIEQMLYAMLEINNNKIEIIKIINDLKYNTNFELLVDKIYLTLIR